MILAARKGGTKRVLESADLVALGRGGQEPLADCLLFYESGGIAGD